MHICNKNHPKHILPLFHCHGEGNLSLKNAHIGENYACCKMNLWTISLKVYCISNLSVTHLKETLPFICLVLRHTAEHFLRLLADRERGSRCSSPLCQVGDC